MTGRYWFLVEGLIVSGPSDVLGATGFWWSDLLVARRMFWVLLVFGGGIIVSGPSDVLGAIGFWWRNYC